MIEKRRAIRPPAQPYTGKHLEFLRVCSSPPQNRLRIWGLGSHPRPLLDCSLTPKARLGSRVTLSAIFVQFALLPTPGQCRPCFWKVPGRRTGGGNLFWMLDRHELPRFGGSGQVSSRDLL